MKMNALSSFAAGILLAAGVSGAVYYFTEDETIEKSAEVVEKEPEVAEVEPLTAEEMQAELESSGYVVQTTEEFDKHIEDAKKAAVEEKPKDEEKESVTQVILMVTEGMTSIDVGKVLAEAKLVDDAFKFTQDVEKKDLQNRLRPGIYKVNSEMSKDEIIAAIFK